MATTAQQLIDSALRLIGELASGETPSSDQRTDAMAALNQLIDSWSAQGVTLMEIVRRTVTLTGSEDYTLATRPLKIRSAAVIAANGVARDVPIVDAAGWARVQDRTRTGIYPEALFHDGGFSSGKVYVSPKPAAGTLELWQFEPLDQVASLSTELSFPPGYERPLRFQLAFDLSSEYGRPVPESVAAVAASSFSAIAGLNAQVLGTPTPPIPGEAAA